MNNNGILLALVIWPMIGALISYLIGRRNKAARSYFADFVTILEFVCIVWLFIKVAGGSEFSWKAADICGMDIYLKMDGFRAVYSGIAILMWMMTTIFSKECFPALLSLKGDQGGRRILREDPEDCFYWPLPDPCEARDIDTLQQYQKEQQA